LYGSIENAKIAACFKMAHFQTAEKFIQIKDMVNFAPQRSDGAPDIACRPDLRPLACRPGLRPLACRYALPTW
jgi:hypothetical protein